MNKDLDAQRTRDMEVFEQEIKSVAQNLPTHKAKEFTFTAFERQMLAEQQTIIALAERTQEKVINEMCLKRVGVMPDPSIHIRYSVSLGRFVMFYPKEKKGGDVA